MKTAQLQIRVSPGQKAQIERAARQAGMGMSAYVLGRLLPPRSDEWRAHLQALAGDGEPRLALAELSAWLANLGAGELAEALDSPPPPRLTPHLANTLAAMVEYACANAGVAPPGWTRDVPPLAQPFFGSTLASLRLHLLAHSPAAFRRRNLFVDTVVGGRV